MLCEQEQRIFWIIRWHYPVKQGIAPESSHNCSANSLSHNCSMVPFPSPEKYNCKGTVTAFFALMALVAWKSLFDSTLRKLSVHRRLQGRSLSLLWWPFFHNGQKSVISGCRLHRIFWKFLQAFFPVSPGRRWNLLRKSPQNVEEIAQSPGGEESVESCPVSGCDGCFGPARFEFSTSLYLFVFFFSACLFNFNRNPDNPYPPKFGGWNLPPKFGGWNCQKPLFVLQDFLTPPPPSKFGGENNPYPPNLGGMGLSTETTIDWSGETEWKDTGL